MFYIVNNHNTRQHYSLCNLFVTRTTGLKKLVGSCPGHWQSTASPIPHPVISRARNQDDRKTEPSSQSPRINPSPTSVQIPHKRTAHDWGCTRPLASVIAPPSAPRYILPPDCALSTAYETQRTVFARWLAESKGTGHFLSCISVRAHGPGSTRP